MKASEKLENLRKVMGDQFMEDIGAGSSASDCSQVLISYPTTETRHHSAGYMTCAKCHDKRQMKNHAPGIYKCLGCGQLWKYPSASV